MDKQIRTVIPERIPGQAKLLDRAGADLSVAADRGFGV